MLDFLISFQYDKYNLKDMLLVKQAGSIGNNIVAMFIFDRSFFMSVIVEMPVTGMEENAYIGTLILAKITLAERTKYQKRREHYGKKLCKYCQRSIKADRR